MTAQTPVILVCPCCASPVDATAAEEPQDFTCVCCGQTWSMHVDASRFTDHALH